MSSAQTRAKHFLLLACEAYRDGADEQSNQQVYTLAADLFGTAAWEAYARGVGERVPEADDAVKEVLCGEGKGYLVEAWMCLMGGGHKNDADKVFELGMRLYGAEEWRKAENEDEDEDEEDEEEEE